jgi:hypothetical protein
MAKTPLYPQDVLEFFKGSIQNGINPPHLPPGYVLATDPFVFGPLLPRLFDAAYISTGIIDPNRLGTGVIGAGNLYLADDGTWKPVSTGGGSQNLQQVTDLGNTTTNSIETNGVKSDYFLLDTTATPTPQTGMMFWDQDSQTPDIQLDAQLAGRVFQDEFWYVKNQTGSQINKGTVVRAVGTLGASSRILIAPMVANGSVAAKYILGITAENIADGADGSVMRAGKIRQLDTSMFAAGDILYANPAVAGGLTATLPEAPNLKLAVAFVVHAATNGVLAVRVEVGSDLYEDHRVQVTSPTDGQLLRYDNTDQRWENWTPNFLTTVPTLDQVTTAGNSTTNAITVGGLTVDTNLIYTDTVNNRVGIGTTTPLDFTFVLQGSAQIRNASNSFSGLRIDHQSIRKRDTGTLGFGTNDVTSLNIFAPSNNVGINTTTDAGYKLDVNGTARVVNDITTNGTFVATSASLSGSVKYFNLIRSTDNFNPFYVTADKVYMNGVFFQLSGQGGGTIYSTNSVGGASTYITMSGPAYYNPTSGVAGTFAVTGQSFMSSGTATFNTLTVSPIINNSGTYSGIFRGLYYNPTLTSITGTTHRAIETTSGDVIFNGGNVGIGTSTPGSALDITQTTSIVRINSSLVSSFHGIEFRNSTNLDAEIKQLPSSGEFRISNGRFVGWGGFTTFYTDTVERMRIRNNGNIIIGATADAGYKLDVNGTARVLGTLTVSTSSTNTFVLQNPNFTQGQYRFIINGDYGLQILDNQGYGISLNNNAILLNSRSTNGSIYIWSQASDITRLQLGGQDRNPTISRTRTIISPVQSSSVAFTPTSGTAIDYSFQHQGNSAFQPNSGNALFTQIELRPTFNTTGTYSGIVRGLYYNPVLTSLTGADHRAIETTAGKIIHQGLTNATHTDQVYYDSTTGELTYGASSGGGAQFVIDYDYNIIGVKDGSNLVFTTSATFIVTKTRVYLNGQRLTRGVGYDYVETGTNQITFAAAPVPSDQIIIEYEI